MTKLVFNSTVFDPLKLKDIFFLTRKTYPFIRAKDYCLFKFKLFIDIMKKKHCSNF